MIIRVFITILFFAITNISIARNFPNIVKHLTKSNGLSSNQVNSIIQDSNGFMWFATEDGLNRYDGYQITVYKNNPNNKYSIASNSIMFLLEDIKNKNNLWIGTSKGLVYYDQIHQKFNLIMSKELIDDRTNNIRIYSMCFDAGQLN